MKTGVKYDRGKLLWNLLPFKQVRQVVEVLTFGAVKYPQPDNWKRVPGLREKYFAAMMRHVTAWWGGERCDPETGCSHLAHAVCCLLFLMWNDDTSSENVQKMHTAKKQ